MVLSIKHLQLLKTVGKSSYVNTNYLDASLVPLRGGKSETMKEVCYDCRYTCCDCNFQRILLQIGISVKIMLQSF